MSKNNLGMETLKYTGVVLVALAIYTSILAALKAN